MVAASQLPQYTASWSLYKLPNATSSAVTRPVPMSGAGAGRQHQTTGKLPWPFVKIKFAIDMHTPDAVYFQPMSRKQSQQSESPQKDRREEERDRRRQSILDAALHLFARKGFQETRLTEIADAARLGKATLYYYFPDKETIYWTIYEEETIAYYKSISDVILSTDDPVKIVALYFTQYIEYGYDNTDFLRLIFPLGKNSPFGSEQHRESMEKVDAVRHPIDSHLATVLETNNSDLNSDDLTELIWTMLSGLSLKIIQGADRADIEREAEIFIDFLQVKIQGDAT